MHVCALNNPCGCLCVLVDPRGCNCDPGLGRYNLRTLQYPFQAKIVDTLMQFLSIILGVRYTWPNLMLFFSNNDANVKAGVREALIRPYEVRLVDLVCEGRGFDIMGLAGSSALGAALPYMAHPDIHPDNSVFKYVGGGCGAKETICFAMCALEKCHSAAPKPVMSSRWAPPPHTHTHHA